MGAGAVLIKNRPTQEGIDLSFENHYSRGMYTTLYLSSESRVVVVVVDLRLFHSRNGASQLRIVR